MIHGQILINPHFTSFYRNGHNLLYIRGGGRLSYSTIQDRAYLQGLQFLQKISEQGLKFR